MSVSEKQILNILREIRISNTNDPQQNVVDMGLVSTILIRNSMVGFTLDLPHTFSREQGEALRRKCESSIRNLDGVSDTRIVLTSATGGNTDTKLPQKKVAPVPPPTPKAIPHIRHIIAIASGKGGVGKSTVAANIATLLAKQGFRTGLVDADIHGPSVAHIMGSKGKPDIHENQLVPIVRHGVKCLSMGMLLGVDDAAVWRGPMVSKALQQLMRGGKWGELDFLIIDFPPGTGDIHLSIAQNFVIAGAVLVSTPQQLSLLDVKKAYSMFEKVHIPIIGVVTNMAYLEQKKQKPVYIFGKNQMIPWCKKMKLPHLAEIPLMPEIAEHSDSGKPYILKAKGTALTPWQQIARAITDFCAD